MMSPVNSRTGLFMSKVRLVLALGTVAWLGLPLFAQHSYGPADIEDGGKLFRANCVSCHGPEGNLVDGVDLGHGKFRRASTEDEVIQIIEDGIPGTAMPPNKLTDFQAGTILAYLRSVATERPDCESQRRRGARQGNLRR